MYIPPSLLCPIIAPSSIPTLSYDTPLPRDSAANHTYETPLERRPPVAISLDGTGSNGAIFSGSVIANHTRSGSHAEASVYEEPILSVPQYDSILGAQVRGHWNSTSFHITAIAS